MAQHLLAVFGAETARPPAALEAEPLKPHHRLDAAESDLQEKQALEILHTTFEASKPATRQLRHPGKGCGFSWESSPYVSYAAREGVHVLLGGEVSHWPGIDMVQASHNAFVRNEQPLEEDDAHWLLDFYRTFTDPDVEQAEGVGGEDVMSAALECLAGIRGSFAFVILDSVRHRVLAARDREGQSHLFWGVTDSGHLVFGSTLADLAACNPSATAFPAGCLFTSARDMVAYSPGPRGWMIEGEDMPGELMSFVAADDAAHFRGVKAIPRITSKGVVCGAVFKVASTADMSHPLTKTA